MNKQWDLQFTCPVQRRNCPLVMERTGRLALVSVSIFVLMFSAYSSHRVAGADAGKTVDIYAVLGNAALITCSGYDGVKLNSSNGNVSDVYSLRWFKNQRSTDYILFTYLDLPPHRISMPQNEWKDRNVTFSIADLPQIRLPNVTFRDDASYLCDLTPASRNAPVMSETRLHVVACPETVDLVIINSTATLNSSSSPSSAATSAAAKNNNKNSTLGNSLLGTPSFLRGTRILVRCSTLSYPGATLTLRIPGLKLDAPEWQNLTESPGDRGYMMRSLDGYFTLDGPDNLLVGKTLTVDCTETVANGTCSSFNSLAIQVTVPQTKDVRSSLTPVNVLPDDSATAVSGLNGAQIAGIIIGCIVAVALIGGLVYLALRHQNKVTMTTNGEAVREAK